MILLRFTSIFIFSCVLTLNNASKSLSKRIVGGHFSYVNQFPHQVSLRRAQYYPWSPPERFTQNVCGGSIISNRFIVTAAHCTTKIASLDELLIGYGTRSFAQNSVFLNAEEIIRHPQFDESIDYLNYDIALIKTKTTIEFNAHVQPIPLAQDWIDGNKSVIVGGWGKRENMEISEYPRHAYMKTMTNEACNQQYGENIFIRDSILCAYGKYGIGLCHGDSGNGLILNDKLIGIGLFNVPEDVPCGDGKPNQFTRISSYFEWIKEQVDAEVL